MLIIRKIKKQKLHDNMISLLKTRNKLDILKITISVEQIMSLSRRRNS